MKNTKHILAFAIVLTLMLSLSIPAFADAQYKYTQDFVSALSEVEGFTCTVNDIWTDRNGDNYEPVRVDYAGGEFSDYSSTFTVMFLEDGSTVYLSYYNLINFEADRKADVINAISDYNASTSGVKLYVDDRDNSVTAEMYNLTTPETASEIAQTAVGFIISFTDAAYEELGSFNK